MTATAARVEDVLRAEAPRVLGALVRRYNDFAAAEDAAQEASIVAALQWPRDGIPNHPRAWLIRVASRRLVDYQRSETARRQREAGAAAERGDLIPTFDEASADEQDDTLLLLFMCCHPSLTTSSAIALTLRAVGGLTTAEIANAFLVPEPTIAQRISRAKESIASSGVPFAAPSDLERAHALRAVLHVLYLIFSEGYSSSTGTMLQRGQLAAEAIRLVRATRRAVPHDPEVAGLLALMLLTDARRDARTGPNGELIPLHRQDRSRWHADEIAEGIALVSAALPAGAVGPYQLQAAIAAVHDEAASAAETDWPQIRALYDVLARISDNPMVALNRAVATAMVHGPRAGLAELHALDSDRRIAHHHRLEAVRGHLFEMSGDCAAAIASYRLAATRAKCLPEQQYLVTQAARLSETGS